MSASKRYEWERTITFEGIELPGTAIAIDLLGTNGNPANLNRETSVWLWRFTICCGRMRTEASWVIEKCAGETLSQLREQRADLIAWFGRPDGFVGEFDEAILDEWEYALKQMLKVAATREQCSWSAPMQE